MNKYLARISVRIMALLVAVLLLVVFMVLVFWRTSVLPVLVASEQTKADLLIGQYAKQLEAGVVGKDSSGFILGLIDEMLLLRDEVTGRHLLNSVRFETLGGLVFERFNETGRHGDYNRIRAEMPIFSSYDQMLFGTLQIVYNEAYYDEMSEYMGIRLMILLGASLLVIVSFGFMVERMTRPLKVMAQTLDAATMESGQDIPRMPRSRTYEINYVATAIEMLLIKVHDREEKLIQEHQLAESALQEKLEAEKANLAKSRFLANMSHELRTPLNAVIGYSEILMEDLEHEGASPAYQKDLSNIRTAAKHLLSLINDVLDISKIEAEKLQVIIEPVDLHGLLNSIVGEIGSVARVNNNKLSLNCVSKRATINSDGKRLRQIIVNLLSNACKFTRNGNVDLLVGDDSETGDLLIKVRDTGIGIAENMVDKVFEAFVQEDNSSVRAFEGTGLGLAISKRLSELLGGSLSLESVIGEGSVFTLRLRTDMPLSDNEGASD